jgi:hypothetical protein
MPGAKQSPEPKKGPGPFFGVHHKKVAERLFSPGATVCLSNRAWIPSRTDWQAIGGTHIGAAFLGCPLFSRCAGKA